MFLPKKGFASGVPRGRYLHAARAREYGLDSCVLFTLLFLSSLLCHRPSLPPSILPHRYPYSSWSRISRIIPNIAKMFQWVYNRGMMHLSTVPRHRPRKKKKKIVTTVSPVHNAHIRSTPSDETISPNS